MIMDRLVGVLERRIKVE